LPEGETTNERWHELCQEATAGKALNGVRWRTDDLTTRVLRFRFPPWRRTTPAREIRSLSVVRLVVPVRERSVSLPVVNRARNPIEIAVYLQKTRGFMNPRSPRRLKRPGLRTGADAYQGCTFL